MRIFSLFLFLSSAFVSLFAEECLHKHSLKCNMIHIHDEIPMKVDNIIDMFDKGIFFNRLRFNSFGYSWDESLEAKRKDHAIAGLGGSLIFRSAYLHDISFALSLYTSKAIGTLKEEESAFYKAGKDTFSRYNIYNNKNATLMNLAEAYIEYNTFKSSLKVGRQIFESVLTKSNDTKMIPNTFEGITLHSKIIANTSFKMAYLTKQKLRDHNHFHHLLAYGDTKNDPYAKYKENDDSAMHRGLTLSKLEALGIEDALFIAEIKNRDITDLTLRANYTAVPQLLSSAMIQAKYRLDINDWSIVPALRYMQQFDDGAGAIAGANHLSLYDGYSNAKSLNAQMLGARIDMVKDTLKLRLGYTYIADKGDFITPWRGFPTGGFTRAMSQYNWYANTKSYMFQVDYKCKEIPNLKFISRFVAQDFDDNKIGVQADSNLFSFDILKILDDKKLYLKTRYAHVVGDSNTITSYGQQKLDSSYDEFRFEINYLF
ncbi:hypothetical protein MNB_SV-13-1372 [hydrothermal vent metagenome]|uniref:Outer membrane porin, OprD family n=1 Tax=hydrothermal vent metagenome TaxID=652676 RepID=A0A1W1C5G4_9ZZZZ